MESENDGNWYEELRKKNLERNQEVMRMLGLLPTSCGKEHEQSNKRSRRTNGNSLNTNNNPRRSERVASLARMLPMRAECSESSVSLSRACRPRCMQSEEKTDVFEKKVLLLTKEMENKEDLEATYSTDASMESLYAVEVNMDLDGRGNIHDNVLSTQSTPDFFGSSSIAPGSYQSVSTDLANAFGTQFHELVMQAVMQSTLSLGGPPPGLSSLPVNMSTGNPSFSTKRVCPEKTWSQCSYNIVKARQNRKPQMTRTSAGEGSDSQEDLKIPEDESPQQRSVRTRRLNRFQTKRSKDLTRNRKAVKKLPYVIHVDGMAKARGIHKHLWRAAVRGQCGRLDPTMDNINHHPKQVVDSIWHALEREWEFEGFTHRAREMFERSATKFMRNRKMQLKYKCQKSLGGAKPDDVSGAYWSKIKDLTETYKKKKTSRDWTSTTSKGKEVVCASENGNNESFPLDMNIEQQSESFVPSSPGGRQSHLLEVEDVDSRILNLQKELLRLQQSRKDNAASSEILGVGELGMAMVSEGDVDNKKENMKPNDVIGENHLEQISNKTTFGKDEQEQVHRVQPIQKINSSVPVLVERQFCGQDLGVELKEMEMDCGDLVRVFAFTGRRREEIGKGIVMGLAGSKYARKVIPKGWRGIKMTSYTTSGGSKICPFPAGWNEQLKSQTVKEAKGRLIMWPDMLLLNLVSNN